MRDGPAVTGRRPSPTDLLASDSEGRMFVYDLAVSMAGWGATTPEDIEAASKFAVADGIVSLTNDPEADHDPAARLFGSAQLTGHGVSFIADNVIVLRYVEVDGHLERAAFVLKARGTGHTTELRRFRIDDRGAHVGEPFLDMRGVLTGIPQPVRAVGKKGRGR